MNETEINKPKSLRDLKELLYMLNKLKLKMYYTFIGKHLFIK